jgi:hypothetical protein
LELALAMAVKRFGQSIQIEGDAAFSGASSPRPRR